VSSKSTFTEFLGEHPGTKYLDIFYPDLSCVVRGKRYPVSQAGKIFESGMMTPGSTFLLAVTGESMDPEGMGFSDGDPDELGTPVPGTLVPAPWSQVPTAQVMLTLHSLEGEPYYYEPRNVLLRVVERFSDLGLRPVVAFEPEFYLTDIERDGSGNLVPPCSPLSGQRTDATQVYSMDDVEDFSRYLDEVTSTCALQGVTTGAISGEYSPGQFEINLLHSKDPVAAADHCVMFRRAVQCIARKHGFQATFMAKPYPENSGSGLHLHISVLDGSGENIFDGGGEYGTRDCGSDTLFHALGGLKTTMADSMGVFAPNANAYRRFVPNIYVPVTPSWGYENRSVAMRIPKSPGVARRIEHRVAGADANPYLTLAVILSGIHHGITNAIDPGEPATGNAGATVDPDLPLDIAQALHRTRQSNTLAHYLGQQYLHAYTSCKLNEYNAFEASGDDETKWYL
jgi:glutamine synthetase